jgi:hypothetical protein|nr:MAG TPA: hypothetical protein [Caudoviricetes sp.]
MLLVDNFDKVKNVVQWKPEQTYYKFVALIRAKDYKDGERPVLLDKEKQECFVRQWLVDSEEYFDRVKEDMKTVVEMFRCRLYMTLDRKSTMKTLIAARDVVNRQLDSYLGVKEPQVSVKMFNKLVPSVTQLAESSDRDGRRWMFDVDTKDVNVLNVVKKLCGTDYLESFETKNGYHVVADKKFDANGRLLCLKNNGKLAKFDDSVFNENEKKLLRESEVEVKANSLVLVAMGA